MAAGVSLRKGIRALVRTTGVGDNPPSGERLLVAKSDGWYDRDSSGVETNLLTGGSSGVLNKVVTSDVSSSNLTQQSINELICVLDPGRYRISAHLIWQSAALTTGASFWIYCNGGTVVRNVGHVYTTTTGTTATTGVADQATVAATFQMIEARAWRANNVNPGSFAGVDTINADQFAVLEATIDVTGTSFQMQPQFVTEVNASAVTVKAGSNLVCTKMD